MPRYQLGIGSTPTLTIAGTNIATTGTNNIRAWSRNLSTGAKVSLATANGAALGGTITLTLNLGATGLAVGQVIEVRAEDDNKNIWVPNATDPDELIIEIVEVYAT